MRARLRLAAGLTVILAFGWITACAEGDSIVGGTGGVQLTGSGGAGGGSPVGSSSTNHTSSGQTATSTTGGPVEQACPPGELMTGLGDAAEIVCAPLAGIAQTAINDGCSVYLGLRDNCDGCALDPLKWGRASAESCLNGAGVDDTCTTPTLGGDVLELFGLNPDGDVDGNDKLYAGLHCGAGESAGAPGPCGPGELVTAIEGDTVTCTPASGAVLGYVNESCSIYLGWRDDCDGCTTAPTKWGRASDASCTNGIGADSTCSTSVLGGETVRLFGLNLDGDVDGNDKLYVGLRCEPPPAESGPSAGACPPGQFVTGTHGDGSVECASPGPLVTEYFDAHCSIWFGWQDQCDGCGAPPSKWGHTSAGTCANGAGADNTCQTPILGGETVRLFGLNPDGDIDGNDALYIAFRCD